MQFSLSVSLCHVGSIPVDAHAITTITNALQSYALAR